MPPLPLDERIVLLQRPKHLSHCKASSSPPPVLPRRASRPQPLSSSSTGKVFHASSCLQAPHLSPYSCNSLSLECKRRWTRGPTLQPDPPLVLVSSSPPATSNGGYDPSHRHSNGTVTLGPRLPSHTHAVDIKVSLDGGTGKATGSGHSLRRGGSLKGGKGGKRVSLHLSHVDEKKPVAREQRSHRQSNGGGLQFVPAQLQQQNKHRGETEQPNGAPGFFPRSDREVSSGGSKKSNQLGAAAHQNHSGLRHPLALPHASVLNPGYPSCSSSPPLNPLSSSSFRSASAGQDPRRRPPVLRGLPLSPGSSGAGGFPSPDHTCTVDLSYPFNCGCWELVRRKGFARGCPVGGGGGGGGGGSPSSSFSCVQTTAAGRSVGVTTGSRAMGLRSLGGCLSAASNTSSSASTASDCRPGLLRPLACASCSSKAPGAFESPAMLRRKLVAGCLPCTPSAPLRAIHSCVTGCDPKASQTASSTCSYCSSDPIVVTFNPRRSNPPPGRGDVAACPRAGAVGFSQSDDDDYSVRTIWPEELAKKMQQNINCAGPGKPSCMSRGGQNGTHSTAGGGGGGGGGGMATLECQNLREFSHGHMTDRAGRRRLWQGKMAALDFMGGGGGGSSGAGDGRSSLRRLLNGEGDATGGGAGEFEDMMLYRPRSPSPPPPRSPVSYSPPPSPLGTLIRKPDPWQRDREREGGRSLPSAQSLHLVLDSLNRDQEEDNSRTHLYLPLSSSLPASLSDEGAVTPDAENAVVSAILPFLFLGNERDAQDLDLLLRLNVAFVVNVTTHLPLYHLTTGRVRYKRLPATDNSKQDLRRYFEEVFEFIEEARQTGRGVLVHCQAGVSRSATVVIAYLMKHTLMTMTDAYKYVRGRRPVVSPNLNFMGQLLEFEHDLNTGVTPRILTPKLSL
ncbi:hypothetical protein NHX12_009804 [Muraenolepis orangiensis]|uniref:protein-tyrosine-phosphatase n=1 Tax=Muraenolepis orangiensis TaxID=630683 RepID=A0A9Q0DIH4_9TELE|nr:hypothetical protein NHX12_009804 [Muraenolepis orangiensis]